jgi:hypothetical protein
MTAGKLDHLCLATGDPWRSNHTLLATSANETWGAWVRRCGAASARPSFRRTSLILSLRRPSGERFFAAQVRGRRSAHRSNVGGVATLSPLCDFQSRIARMSHQADGRRRYSQKFGGQNVREPMIPSTKLRRLRLSLGGKPSTAAWIGCCVPTGVYTSAINGPPQI